MKLSEMWGVIVLQSPCNEINPLFLQTKPSPQLTLLTLTASNTLICSRSGSQHHLFSIQHVDIRQAAAPP